MHWADKNSHQAQSSKRNSKRSTASSAESFLVGVGVLADGELTRRLLRRIVAVLSVSSCGHPARRVDQFRRSEKPRRSVPAASVSSPVDVVLGPGLVSQHPDGKRARVKKRAWFSRAHKTESVPVMGHARSAAVCSLESVQR